MRNVKPSAGCKRSKARTHRFSRPRATGRVDSTPNSPVSSTSSCSVSEIAAAMQSNPGPWLADEAGTRTALLRITQPRFLDRADLDRCGDHPPVVVGDCSLGVLQAAAGEHAH